MGDGQELHELHSRPVLESAHHRPEGSDEQLLVHPAGALVVPEVGRAGKARPSRDRSTPHLTSELAGGVASRRAKQAGGQPCPTGRRSLSIGTPRTTRLAARMDVRGGSSAGQSKGLIIPGSRVRAPPAPLTSPQVTGLFSVPRVSHRRLGAHRGHMSSVETLGQGVEVVVEQAGVHVAHRGVAGDELASAGYEACDWLENQPWGQPKGPELSPLTKGKPIDGLPEGYVTYAAWDHLCPLSQQIRRPILREDD